jgi:hypothetical protein
MPRSIDDLALDAVGKPPRPPRQETPVVPPRPRENQVDSPALAQKMEKAKSSLFSAIAGFALMIIGVVAMIDGACGIFLDAARIAPDPLADDAMAFAGGLAFAATIAFAGKLTALLGAIVFGVGCLVVAAGND